MNKKSPFFRGLFSRISWMSGIGIGVLLTSGLVIATVTLSHTFQSGDTIVASEVNENFTDLAAAINDTRYGYVVSLSSSQTFAYISGTTYADAELDTILKSNIDPADYDTGTYEFTVPTGESGFYVAHVTGTATPGTSCDCTIEYAINGGTEVQLAYLNTNSNSDSTSFWLNDGDVLKFRFGISDNMGCSGTSTFNSNTIIVAVVRAI